MLLLFLWPKIRNLHSWMVGFGKSSVCTYVRIFVCPEYQEERFVSTFIPRLTMRKLLTMNTVTKWFVLRVQKQTHAYIWESFSCLIIKSFPWNSTIIKIPAINECMFKSFMLQFHCYLCLLFSPPHFVDIFELVIPKHCYLPYFFHTSTEHCF